MSDVTGCRWFQNLCKSTRLHHEAEDVKNIPQDYSDVTLLMASSGKPSWQTPQISVVLTVTRGLGCHPVGMEPENLKMLNMGERLKTFTDHSDWRGPPSNLMAQAGWSYVSDDRAACPFCTLELRYWQQEDDPWLCHRQWSPACRFLRQAKGKLTLRNSFSSLYDFTRST